MANSKPPMTRSIAIIALSLCFAGCFRTTLILDPAPSEAWPSTLTTKVIIVGLVPLDGEVDLSVCEAGVARVEQHMELLGNGFTMMRVRIYCLDGARREAWLGEDGHVYADEENRTMETVSGVTAATF